MNQNQDTTWNTSRISLGLTLGTIYCNCNNCNILVLISIAMKKNIAIYIAQTWDIAINIGTSSNVVPVKFASK